MVASWLQVFSLLMLLRLAVKQIILSIARYISVFKLTLIISIGADQLLVRPQEKNFLPISVQNWSKIGQKLQQI